MVQLVAVGVSHLLGGVHAFRALAHITLLVDLLGMGDARHVDAGLLLLLIPVVVALGGGSILIGSAEAVEHTAEKVALAAGTNHLGHVSGRHQHVLHLVDISVLTGDVGDNDLVAEDVGRVLLLVVGRTRNHLEVAVLALRGDVVVGHLLFGKMHHHRLGGVHHHVEAGVVILLPIAVVHGHGGLVGQEGDGVDDIGTRRVLQCLSLSHCRATVADVREHFYQHGVVEHRAVEQLALHSVGEVFIAPHAPGVALVEAAEGLVIGREDGFRTSLGQCLGIAQVVDESQVVAECALQHISCAGRQGLRVLHCLIDTVAQPRRVVARIVEVVVISTGREDTAHNRQADGNTCPAGLFQKAVYHTSFFRFFTFFVVAKVQYLLRTTKRNQTFLKKSQKYPAAILFSVLLQRFSNHLYIYK